MNREPNSEEKLRAKLQKHEFAFSEEAWERMDQLLSAENKKTAHAITDNHPNHSSEDQKNRQRRIVPFWLLFLSLGTTTLSIAMLSNNWSLIQEKTPTPKTQNIIASPNTEGSDNGVFTVPSPNDSNHLAENPRPPKKAKESFNTNHLTPNNPSFEHPALATNKNNQLTQQSPTMPSAGAALMPPLSKTTTSLSMLPTTLQNPLESGQRPAFSSLSQLETKASKINYSQALAYKVIRPAASPHSTWTFFAEAGISVSPSWIQGLGTPPSLVGGMGVEFQKGAWGFGLQVQAQRIKQLSFTSQFSQVKATPLGFNSVNSEVTTKALTLGQLQLNGFFQLFPRHRLIAGSRISRLWIAKEAPVQQDALVTQLEAESFFAPVLSNDPGIRRWDLGVYLGYQYRLHPRIHAQVLFHQGLFDLTHDNWFAHEHNDLNTDLQLLLRYDF